MGVEVALSLIQTLLTALQCSDKLTKFSSIFSSKTQLDQLRNTVARIQAVLLDAQTKYELSHDEKVCIEQLKDVLYEADDLFDEILTLTQREQLTKGLKERCSFLFNKLESALRMSQEFKNIKSKLDAIAKDNQLSNLKHNPEPLKKRRPETCSYVRTVEIIGREADVEKIVGLLLQSDVQQDVSCLSIVGIGGLGKTALAQLVFNDSRVTTTFTLKLWTCISDLGQGQLDIDGILRKILASINNGEKNESLTLDRVQNDIRENLARNRYLLILDDVWTENSEQWSRLTSFLMGGQRGSWIMVTTRSKKTANMIHGGSMHELQGLSEKDSWQLFKGIAFGYVHPNPPRDLLEIGQDIVVQCANVPLAIRVMGSFLYGQDKHEWLSIQKHGLIKIQENENCIMSILRLSYQQLEYPLKSCFAYCAIFPKDYVMKKKTLMRLWIAQGYITPEKYEIMEDVAEKYFMVLSRRCFFQDIVEDEFGDVDSCKVHDLMHDVAQEIAGKEIYVSGTINGDMDKKIRHVHLTSGEPTKYTFTKSYFRSYLQGDHFENTTMDKHLLDTLLNKWKYLRVLCLIRINANSVSSSISDLLHLRYIDFSSNRYLQLLPKEITKLYNLQTLILRNCSNLKELPKDMSKLVKIRVLDIYGCAKLTCMPANIGKLECLQELPMFVMGEVDSSWDSVLKILDDLKAMKNLKGFLEIKCKILKQKRNVEKEGGGYLLNKKHLNHVNFNFLQENGEGRVENDEVVFKELQPHSNVKRLQMWHYQGVRMPQWFQEVNLTNLIKLEFIKCRNLLCLGCVGNLHHLKYLYLDELENLKCLIEKNTNCDSDSIINNTLEFSFFPSLQTLNLENLPELKGWWKAEGMQYNEQIFRLPQLTELKLQDCPELIASVECPILENLEIKKVNKNLRIIIIRGNTNGKERGEVQEPSACAIENVSSSSCSNHPLKLRKVIIDNLKWLSSLQQMEAFRRLHSLDIDGDKEVESFGEGGDVHRGCSSSLRYLRIWGCWKLRSVCGGLEHLTALEELSINYCPNLRLSEEEEREGGSSMTMPWQSLNHSLRTLELCYLPQLVNLPNWIQNLTSLQTLRIWRCKELKSLPKWMSNLTSLRLLRIYLSSEALKERCTDSTGEDWPHIKHIPTIDID